MGFFSWKTSDTKQSIPNVASGRHTRPVYLLQPNGKAPIEEREYEGHGRFGDVDAYVWLAKENAEAIGLSLAGKSEEAIRLIGISLSVGDCYKDTETGDIWHIFHDARDIIPGHYFAGRYDQIIPALNGSPNDLIDSGRLERLSVAEVVSLPYPLKFSFDPAAKYDALPAAENCPDQGYFY